MIDDLTLILENRAGVNTRAGGVENPSMASYHPLVMPDTLVSGVRLIETLLGAVFAALGAAALALSAVGSRSKDRSLASLGVVCMAYGMRLMGQSELITVFGGPRFWDYLNAFVTYFILVPFGILIEQLTGRGWKSSIRLLWQLEIPYAVAAAAVDLAMHQPGYCEPANPWVVGVNIVNGLMNLVIYRNHVRLRSDLKVVLAGFIVFLVLAGRQTYAPNWALPEWFNLEPLGMLVFLSTLGYWAARRVFANERTLAVMNYELDTARRIQMAILPGEAGATSGIDVAARYIPMTAVAGDFYDYLEPGEGKFGVLVADVCGHGVPAALVASMLKVAFTAQASHAAEPARLLDHINQTLCGKLERSFVTAIYVFVDRQALQLRYAGAGHPPLLLRRPDGSLQTLLKNGLPLGRFPAARYSDASLELQPGDRLLLYTDGIPEAQNKASEFFGAERLNGFLQSNGHGSPAEFADAFLQHLTAWSGRRAGESFDDDTTLVVLDIR